MKNELSQLDDFNEERKTVHQVVIFEKKEMKCAAGKNSLFNYHNLMSSKKIKVVLLKL